MSIYIYTHIYIHYTYPLNDLQPYQWVLCTRNCEELSCSPLRFTSQVWFQGWSSWFLDWIFWRIVGQDGTGMLLGNVWIKCIEASSCWISSSAVSQCGSGIFTNTRQPKYPELSKLAILRTLPLLYRFKPFHWRVPADPQGTTTNVTECQCHHFRGPEQAPKFWPMAMVFLCQYSTWPFESFPKFWFTV